jgi:hypothetical protein
MPFPDTPSPALSGITHRWVKNDRLNHARYLWALSALRVSPGAMDFFPEGPVARVMELRGSTKELSNSISDDTRSQAGVMAGDGCHAVADTGRMVCPQPPLGRPKYP